MDDLRFLTTKEVAELAGTSDSTVRRALLDGRLWGHKLGGRWLVHVEDAQKWADLPHQRGRPPKQLRMRLDDGS